MESFSAGQCPWAVTGEGGQNACAAVAVRAAYTSLMQVQLHITEASFCDCSCDKALKLSSAKKFSGVYLIVK